MQIGIMKRDSYIYPEFRNSAWEMTFHEAYKTSYIWENNGNVPNLTALVLLTYTFVGATFD